MDLIGLGTDPFPDIDLHPGADLPPDLWPTLSTGHHHTAMADDPGDGPAPGAATPVDAIPRTEENHETDPTHSAMYRQGTDTIHGPTVLPPGPTGASHKGADHDGPLSTDPDQELLPIGDHTVNTLLPNVDLVLGAGQFVLTVLAHIHCILPCTSRCCCTCQWITT